MKYKGSKTLITDRLILKPQTMSEQKLLWQILIKPEVNKYYLTIPRKFKDKIMDWETQKQYYEEEMKSANNSDVFKWSIFLKTTNECIGKVDCHEAQDENSNIINKNIRGVGWYINPSHQNQGYATEAAKAMIDYMFLECDIDAIVTGAAIDNPASWKIMEKLGFKRQPNTKMVNYTFMDESVPCYQYILKKDEYMMQNK